MGDQLATMYWFKHKVEMTTAWTSLLVLMTLMGSISSWTSLVVELNERIISKNTFVDTIPVLGKEWRVTFEVMISIKDDVNPLLLGETSWLRNG